MTARRLSTRIHIGTSGWYYDHWRGRFYPASMSSDQFLSHYARHFQTVEINNTFYQLPSAETFVAWRDGTPPRFLFACKASRYITHMKKLADPARTTERFFEAIQILGSKLGPVLFQLPPRWHVNADRLRAFLRTLPKSPRFAFEFRDPSWFAPEIYAALAEHHAAFCIYDLAGLQSPIETTTDFVYIRLHGPGGPYRGKYDDRALRAWARRCRAWIKAGKDVYCYFDNDERGYAVQDALELQQMLVPQRD